MEELSRSGKVSGIGSVITPESTRVMNEEMTKVRRDFRRKQAESARLARETILTA